MDLSDDIAYSVHDFEDAIVNGYVDVEALGARVDHDALVTSMYEWIGGAISHDELIAAFDRLDSLDGWLETWSGSRLEQGRLKNLTSQLIGRFAHAATEATRSAFPLASLIRFDADVVVPREIQAEIAVLKGIVAAFVMSRNTRQPIYAQQRQVLTSLADVLFATGDEHLDPGFAADWNAARRRRRAQARRRRPGREPHRPVGARLVRATRAAVTGARRGRDPRRAAVGPSGRTRMRAMAGRIRQSDVDEVKARTNIADIVGEHVSLKSAGVGSLKGLCPFHDERSPSFHVRPQLGYYHCFGCGESGDVYTFLQRMDHVSFTEAVERLAGRIGFELHYEDGGQAVRPRQPRAAARRQPGRRRVLRRAPRRARRRRGPALPRRARLRRRGRRAGSASASRRRAGTRSPTTSRPAGSRPRSSRHPVSSRRAIAACTTGSAAASSGPSATSPGRPSDSARAGSSTTTRARSTSTPPRRRSTTRRRCSTGSTSPSATSPRPIASSWSRGTPTSWRATSPASPPRSPRAARRSASTTSRCCAACSATTRASARSSSRSTATRPASRRRCAPSARSSGSRRRPSWRSRPTASTRATCGSRAATPRCGRSSTRARRCSSS